MDKRVLHSGGLELIHKMLAALNVQPGDELVEFAPDLHARCYLRYWPDENK